MIGFSLGAALAVLCILVLNYSVPPDKVFLSKGIQDFLSVVVGPVAAGFGGAIAGSYVAHALQKQREIARDRKEKGDVLNESIIVLMTKLNDLLSIRKYSFAPHENELLRFADIPKLPVSPGVTDKVSSGLSRVLLSIGEVDNLTDIRLAELKYEACFQNFQTRNEALDGYGKRTISVSVRDDRIPFELLLNAVGVGNMMRLYRSTEAMLVTFDDAIAGLQAALSHITIDCKESFRKAGIHVRVIPLESTPEMFKKLAPPQADEAQMHAYLQSLVTD